jgi:hypothetical protein
LEAFLFLVNVGAVESRAEDLQWRWRPAGGGGEPCGGPALGRGGGWAPRMRQLGQCWDQGARTRGVVGCVCGQVSAVSTRVEALAASGGGRRPAGECGVQPGSSTDAEALRSERGDGGVWAVNVGARGQLGTVARGVNYPIFVGP